MTKQITPQPITPQSPSITADESPVTPNPWNRLRHYTDARIGLGRAGHSLPTDAHLSFQLDHARARDAIHQPLDIEALSTLINERQHSAIHLHSAVRDRAEYLKRPDLGRCLSDEAIERLQQHSDTADVQTSCDIALIIADGLSARAIHDNIAPMLDTLLPRISAQGWTLGPITLVEQGRVAIGDPIGEQLKARMSVIMIGERPGLSSPDSLGIYFTWAPRSGRRDSERNCISNVRPAGQSYAAATDLLIYLMLEAERRQLSGVQLKDDSIVDSQLGDGRQGNLLLPH